MKRRAAQKQREAERWARPGGNYTGLERVDRWYIGWVGEEVARDWFRSHGLDAQLQAPRVGYHQSDILVNGRRIEVKTQAHPGATDFFFPAAQKIVGDYVLAVHWNPQNDWASIRGALSRDEALALPTKTYPPHTVPTRFCRYESLTITPSTLIEILNSPLPTPAARI